MYEELWHGEAFSRFLGEAGRPLPPDQERVGWDSAYPTKVARNTWIRRRIGSKGYFAHIATLIGSALLGKHFPAIHMTWGAVNEFSTLSGYQLLIATTQHPVLKDLLARIIKDERRHYAFYRAQAEMRLSGSPRARRVTRWVMEHLWAPVGTGVRPQDETDFVIAYLLGGSNGMTKAREMDLTVTSIPGLEGTKLFENAARESIGRTKH